MKKNIFLVLLSTISLFANANDTIRFTWQGGAYTNYRLFRIIASEEERFTVNWGDGAIDAINGIGSTQFIAHLYADKNAYNVIVTGVTANCLFTEFWCIDYPLTMLDVKGSTKLKKIECYYSKLPALDLRANTELTYLDCHGNQLTALDVSKNTALIYFDCRNNLLTMLDISANTELTQLDCSTNELTELNVSTNTKLSGFGCSENKLAKLDISKNTKLTDLSCGRNQLTVLDVSKNTALVELGCDNNNLTKLDVSMNTELTHLGCENNQLTTLDASANTKLEWLQCENNQLTALDIDIALEWLYCKNNSLPLSELYALSEKISYSHFAICFGTQNLLPITAGIGEKLFEKQSVFKGIYTDYVVTQNGSPASENDYTITDGKIMFNTLGNYTVTMTNDAIISEIEHPTKVVVVIDVSDVGVEQLRITNYELQVYPNPTTNQLTIDNGELTIESVELIDVYGKSVLHHCERSEAIQKIDASHLENGIYFMKITTDKGMSVKKVVKQ